MSDDDSYRFAHLLEAISSAEVYEYPAPERVGAANPAQLTEAALREPIDFPALLHAVVPGDRIAIAVDPNVPQLELVLESVLKHFTSAEPSGIDIVLGDEVCASVGESISRRFGSVAEVHIHRGDARDGLRYLGADAAAEPVYLNRWLVDADFVLPIVSQRSCIVFDACGHAGVFPAFADAASRRRFEAQEREPASPAPLETVASTLGVQALLSVAADRDGEVAAVAAGTPSGLREHWIRESPLPEDGGPSTSIIVATLDGDQQQQTWINAARGAVAASQLLDQGGTIILWTRIRQAPGGWQVGESSHDPESFLASTASNDGESLEDETGESDGDGFPTWDSREVAADVLSRVAAEYRLMLHSDLDHETIESLGLGVISSVADLQRLTKSFRTCGVLRAAALASPRSAPHQPHLGGAVV